MHVCYALIGGESLATKKLTRALEKFAQRDDVESIPPPGNGDATFVGSVDEAGTGTWLDLREPRGVGAMVPLFELASSLAKHAKQSVTLIASGMAEPAARDGRTAVIYEAFEVPVGGRPIAFRSKEGDEFLKDLKRMSRERAEREAYELLCRIQKRESSTPPEEVGVTMRLEPCVEDPRLAELVGLARAASAVQLDPQRDGRTLLRIEVADGSRRLAFLSADEAKAVADLVEQRTSTPG